MADIISAQEIEATNAFQSIKETYLRDLILKRDNRKIIDMALIMHRSTGQLPPTLTKNQINIVTEILSNDEEKKDS